MVCLRGCRSTLCCERGYCGNCDACTVVCVACVCAVRVCEGDSNAGVGSGGGGDVVVVSACMSGSGVLSSTGDVLEMSVCERCSESVVRKWWGGVLSV